MSIETVLSRSRLRENGIYTPFTQCFIGTFDSAKRTILFGLYANGFENGFAYLVGISAERLQQLIDEYESNMAQLDAEQQKSVLEIASKRYMEVLDQQIHDQKMIEKQAQIDVESLEFDAKEDALDADRAALETLGEKLTQAITKTDTEISVLEARLAEEETNLAYVEVDILQKELAVKKTNLQILEAGVKGVSIQLDIQNVAIQTIEMETEEHEVQQRMDLIPGDLTEVSAMDRGLYVDTLHSNTSRELLDAEIAGIENKVARTNIDIESKGVDAQLMDVDIEKARVDTAMVDVDIQKLQVKVAQEVAKRDDLETDTALIDIRVADLQLDTDKVNAQLIDIKADIAMLDVKMTKEDLLAIDKRIAELRQQTMEYEIQTKKQAQIDAVTKQIEIIEAKITATEEYQTIEKDAYASKQTKQTAEQGYRLAMASMDYELSIHRAEIKIESFSEDIIIAEEERGYQELGDKEQIKVPDSQISAARIGRSAAEAAAKTMATANIINTLTHTIGAL